MERSLLAQITGGVKGLQKVFAKPPTIGLAPAKPASSNGAAIGATNVPAYRGQARSCFADHALAARTGASRPAEAPRRVALCALACTAAGRLCSQLRQVGSCGPTGADPVRATQTPGLYSHQTPNPQTYMEQAYAPPGQGYAGYQSGYSGGSYAAPAYQPPEREDLGMPPSVPSMQQGGPEGEAAALGGPLRNGSQQSLSDYRPSGEPPLAAGWCPACQAPLRLPPMGQRLVGWGWRRCCLLCMCSIAWRQPLVSRTGCGLLSLWQLRAEGTRQCHAAGHMGLAGHSALGGQALMLDCAQTLGAGSRTAEAPTSAPGRSSRGTLPAPPGGCPGSASEPREQRTLAATARPEPVV